MSQNLGPQKPSSSFQLPCWGRGLRGLPCWLHAVACSCWWQVLPALAFPGQHTWEQMSDVTPSPAHQRSAHHLCSLDACSVVTLLTRSVRKKALLMKSKLGILFAPWGIHMESSQSLSTLVIFWPLIMEPFQCSSILYHMGNSVCSTLRMNIVAHFTLVMT